MIDSSEAGSPASDEKRIRKKGLEIEVRKEKSKKRNLSFAYWNRVWKCKSVETNE